MDSHIPPAQEVRERLALLARSDLIALAHKSGVPFTTLQKIQRGETEDPRIETVRAVWPHVKPERARRKSQAGEVSHG